MSGFDKPLDIKFKMNKMGLQAALKQEVGSGPLGESFRLSLIKNGINIQSPLPYAEIQDVGGTIPAFSGKLMVFKSGGEDVFTMKRGPIVIRPKHYAEKAVNRWYKGIDVVWT